GNSIQEVICMKLYLVQHAEAKKKDEDPQRPLSEKGWTDIKKVAAFAAEQANIKVSNIMHSGKTRARQTAEAMADYLTPPEGIRKEEGLEPLGALEKRRDWSLLPILWCGQVG
ncbi:MAG: histidine phosphatase family protein, partial [Deltaproteobacteria bacterium]|nr:histidine phosphatase family protein [Deltaproteobacteria bacterium]